MSPVRSMAASFSLLEFLMFKTRTPVTALLLSAFMLAGRSATAQTIDPAFRADIEKLMELTGTAKLGAQIASSISGQILDSFKQSGASVPEKAFTLAKEVLDAEA
jgi:hypothetical protein